MEGNLLYFLHIVRYAVAVLLLLIIFLAPAWLAAQTKKDKTNAGMIRLANWTLGWTIIGWIWALFWAAKK